MAQPRSLEFKVGIFVIVGLVAIAGLIIKFGKLEQASSGTYDITVRFPNVGGIVRNAVVMYAGIPIGKVKSITLTETGPMKVRLDLAIYQGYIIRKDAKFVISQSGLLGDRYVDVIPESATAAPLGPGSEAEGTASIDLAAAASDVVDVLHQASGTIGRIDGTVRLANLAIQRISDILLTTQNLVNVGTTLTHIDATASNAALLTAHLEGTLGDTRQSLSNTLERFSVAADDLQDAAKRVRGMVQTNEENISVTVSNLAVSTVRLNEILAGVQKGEGTAGKLLTDPTLHDELVRLVENWRRYGILYRDKNDRPNPEPPKQGKTPIPARPAPASGTNSGSTP